MSQSLKTGNYSLKAQFIHVFLAQKPLKAPTARRPGICRVV